MFSVAFSNRVHRLKITRGFEGRSIHRKALLAPWPSGSRNRMSIYLWTNMQHLLENRKLLLTSFLDELSHQDKFIFNEPFSKGRVRKKSAFLLYFPH
mmetsp:Transcript_23311/g.35450  ORF Transcript_23311/g.35450 Transcript_23311/m.35450 type:complete len:97 (-) Transcript_23311:538-828(-)